MSDVQRVLVARAGAEYFAFPLAGVLEALDGAEVAPLPLLPNGVLGQCTHRGALLPVLDPGAVLGAALEGARAGAVGTVLVMADEEPFALAMDDVADMVVVEADARRPVPTGADRGGMIAALFKHDRLLVGLVDAHALRAVAASVLSPGTR